MSNISDHPENSSPRGSAVAGNAQDLRRRAEGTLRQKEAKEAKDQAPMSAEETQLVLHEQRVHQIELEMQNEELRRTQVELDSARAEYFNLYDLAPVGYCTISEQGLLLKANLTAASLLGVARSALAGRRMSSFILKEDQDIYYRHFKQLVVTGVAQVFELRLSKSDGTILWAQLVATAVQDNDGLTLCRLALSDISALKKAEGKLHESEQNFKNLVNSGMALIWTAGTDKLCDYFNGVWLEFTGRSLEEELGNGWAKGVHPDDFQRCLGIYIGAFDRQEPFSMEYRLRHHDGTYRWIVDEGCPRYDSQGEFLGYIGHCLDIDERKQVEEKLQQTLQQYALVLDGAAGGIWDWNVPGKTVHFSSRWKKLRGYTDEEIGDSETLWLDNIHPDDRQAVKARIAAHFAGKTAYYEAEYRIHCKNGSWKWIYDRGKAIEDSTGKVVRMAGSEIDITDRKQAEEERLHLQTQLQQAQKMEAIGTLAGGIAHDFNNILGAILGYAEIAQEDSPTGSTLRKDIDQIVIAGHRAKDLVKQILAFSRQAETVRIPLQPAIIVREATKMLRSSLPSTIEIQQSIDVDCGLILADPTQIHQIVINLGTNALHAMEETGGTLSISLQKKTLTDQDVVSDPGVKSGDFVQLSIRDTGPGIDPKFWGKIFDPYFTTKEIGKGTGMGLAIIHGIVKSYGGSLSFHSHPGEGTVFQVLLPVMVQEVVVEDKPAEILQFGNERILLVDDEELLAEMGKSMLERLGYRVTVRSSSLEALTTFQNQPEKFDLVITDQTMPGMTGSDLARRILQIRPFMPIILCTGYSSLISEEKAKSFGIKGFAMKPLARKSISVLIREVLAGRAGNQD